METKIKTENGHGHCKNENSVVISINGVSRRVDRGHYVVAELKCLLQIDPCHDLDEVVCGEFRPLQDSDKIHIKGGEMFVSHVRCGASS